MLSTVSSLTVIWTLAPLARSAIVAALASPVLRLPTNFSIFVVSEILNFLSSGLALVSFLGGWTVTVTVPEFLSWSFSTETTAPLTAAPFLAAFFWASAAETVAATARTRATASKLRRIFIQVSLEVWDGWLQTLTVITRRIRGGDAGG